MRLVTKGTTPQRAQTWKSAVFVPKLYADASEASRTRTVSDPAGQDVHTPPCRVQNEQVQARAGISAGSGRHSSTNDRFAQWQLPEISTRGSSDLCGTKAERSQGAHSVEAPQAR
jgi:hypothetical protein